MRAVEAVPRSRGLCPPLDGAAVVLGSATECGVRRGLVLPYRRRWPGVALREEAVVSARSASSVGGLPASLSPGFWFTVAA